MHLGCEAEELRALLISNALTQDKNELEQTLQDLDAQITLIRSEHYEYLSHGTSSRASQSVASSKLPKALSRNGSQTSASYRRKILEASVQGQEEKEMAEIQMERNRMNALHDVRDSGA